jgi:hypothetical protein
MADIDASLHESPKTLAEDAGQEADAASLTTGNAARVPPELSARLGFFLALVMPTFFFFVLPPLTKSGLWDPHELNVADLARRIALNLHGASSLALEGSDNSLPHLNDLGRPQLPFTSMALGFKLFGLHEWAGRAPLAVWGILGVLATYGFVSRLVDRRAGVFSAVVLTSMPLYFVQSRTMLGDIVMMASFAMSFGGLAVAGFGTPRADETGERAGAIRIAYLALAALGLVAGYFTRGSLLGVGVPAASIGLAYLVVLGNGHRHDRLGHIAGLLAFAVGGYFCARGVACLSADHFNDETVSIGGVLMKPPAKQPTFDVMIGHLAAALVPWSGLIPFAFGRLFASPVRVAPGAFARESHVRLALVIAAAAAFAAHGWMAGRADFVAFSAPCVMAAACGIAFRDYERGAHPSIAVGVGAAVLLGLMHHEFKELPEKAFQAFGVAATFPEAFKAHSYVLWSIVLVGFALAGMLTWIERDATREPFEPKAYVRVLLALRDAWDGMLALGYFAIVAGSSLAGLLVWVGTRTQARWLPQLSANTRDYLLNAWWIAAFLPLAGLFAVQFWSDVWVWAFDKTPARDKDASLTERWGRVASRGFEPFEELYRRIKEGRIRETLPTFLKGELHVSPERTEDGEGLVALLVLAPLMLLQLPLIFFVVLTAKAGVGTAVAAAVALPSGVALFLALGILGHWVHGSRAGAMLVFGAAVSAILCVSYFPALANQLSPKEVFEVYRRARKNDEPIALYGVGGRTAAYYAGGQPTTLRDPQAASEWLLGSGPGQRRFLAVRSEDLARLNRAYREKAGARRTLPVLDARASQIVLAASSLSPGETNENPLSRMLLDSAPRPQRPLSVNLEEKLEVLGVDLMDAQGKLVDSVVPGKPHRLRTYFKVLAPLGTEWDMFIHIDGFKKRHNGDHKVTGGKYPMTLWLPEDVVVDEHEFKLEPNFTPGQYTIWLGLFSGETRLKVKSGPSDSDNRVNAGTLRVR